MDAGDIEADSVGEREVYHQPRSLEWFECLAEEMVKIREEWGFSS
jgi:hypothetical protein